MTVDERMAAQNGPDVNACVHGGGGGAAPRAVRLDEAALQQWLVDVSQNKANTPAQQNAAWLLLQTVARSVQACRAEQTGPDSWSCDCFHMRPDCKPNLAAGVKEVPDGR